jgi:hypothetical protein
MNFDANITNECEADKSNHSNLADAFKLKKHDLENKFSKRLHNNKSA